MPRHVRALGPLFVATTIAVFVIGMAIAMYAYPGGTWCARDTVGYDLVRNFLCDLLHDPALDGRPSRTAAVTSAIAMLAAFAGLLATFWIAPRLFAARVRVSRVVRALGALAALGGVGVALTPSNVHPTLHTTSVFFATLPGLGATIAASIGLAEARSRPTRVAAALGFATVIVAAVDAWLYARQLDGSHACELALPVLERIAAACLFTWMGLVAALVARQPSASASATPKPPAPSTSHAA